MIQIDNIIKSFNNNLVLNDLSLTVNKGETLVIIGKSGSGKSVLLKLIIGLLKPETGSILIEGNDIVKNGFMALQEIRKHFGFVFQASALFDSMTVAENITLMLRKRLKWPGQKISERTDECLRFVGLEGLGDKRPSELSGGMKKRVGIARAIASYPQYILFDEPTTGLDPETAENINQLILKLKNELDVTSLVVTHDMKSAFAIADQISLLHEGKIVIKEEPADIIKSEHPEIRKFLHGYSLFK
jgi:phospholipid/cholesterol/gamma-HCH transport system ATP-binding protein